MRQTHTIHKHKTKPSESDRTYQMRKKNTEIKELGEASTSIQRSQHRKYTQPHNKN